MKLCNRCSKEVDPGLTVGKRDVCSSCGADLRCCLNCRHYDAAASKQCREPVAELVKDKERANYCEFFLFADGPSRAEGSAEKDAARKSLEDLFKK